MYEGYRTPEQLNIPDFEKLRVTIRNSNPPISREILIPENATFEDLHLTLQVAFGWRDQHLHQFEAGFVVGPAALNDGPVSASQALDERLLWLYDLPPDEAVAYEYDMGDSWEHEIERLGKVHADGRETRPFITGGVGAGPAEDSGGISHWNELAQRFRNGEGTDEDAEWLDDTGYGRDYDVVAFDVDEANARLARIDFDIAGTWEGQYRKRASIKVVAPFLTDRSNAIQESSVEPGISRGR